MLHENKSYINVRVAANVHVISQFSVFFQSAKFQSFVVQSCNFHPCDFVRHFPVMHVFSPANSAISALVIIVVYCIIIYCTVFQQRNDSGREYCSIQHTVIGYRGHVANSPFIAVIDGQTTRHHHHRSLWTDQVRFDGTSDALVHRDLSSASPSALCQRQWRSRRWNSIKHSVQNGDGSATDPTLG